MGDKTRAEVLLKAAYDMLKKQRDSRFVISPFETTVFYDAADCDGYCLMEDIEAELRLKGESITESWRND